MLDKCKNSSCTASFLHLADGRLFRLETETRYPSPNPREAEYFWLCGPCAAVMTLHLLEDGTVAAVGLADALCTGPRVALDSINREGIVHSFVALAFFPQAIRKAERTDLSGPYRKQQPPLS